MESSCSPELVDLILRTRDGDDDAFSALVATYNPLLRGLVAASATDPSEGFAEACIGLYKAALSFDVEQTEVTFGLYARICASRRLTDLARSRARATDRLTDTDVDSIAVGDGIISRLLAKEHRSEMHKRAEEILSKYEYSVFLSWLSGCSTADIAAELGSSKKSIDNAKSRIIKKLKDGLESSEQ